MAKSVKKHSAENYFDYFWGRQVRHLFLEADFKSVSTYIYPTPIFPPLSQEAKLFSLSIAQWYAQSASPHLSASELEVWNSYFDPTSSQYILDRDDFYFSENAYVNVGIV